MDQFPHKSVSFHYIWRDFGLIAMVKNGFVPTICNQTFSHLMWCHCITRDLSREYIAAEPGLLPWLRTLHFTILNTNRKDSKRSSAQPCISLIESLQTFPGHESIQLQLNLKNKVSSYFFFISLCVAL